MDTVVVHLAGALGVVLLLSVATDWRWMEDRDDSPWYPGTMRLFRQTEVVNWDTVINNVVVELRIGQARVSLHLRYT